MRLPEEDPITAWPSCGGVFMPAKSDQGFFQSAWWKLAEANRALANLVDGNYIGVV